MKLIAIQRNVFINIDKIESMESRRSLNGFEEIFIKTDNDEYLLERPLEEFLREIKLADSEHNKNDQFVAV